MYTETRWCKHCGSALYWDREQKKLRPIFGSEKCMKSNVLGPGEHKPGQRGTQP